MQTLRFWLKGIRFYIACGSGLVALLVAWWAHAAYSGTILYPTRMEEWYAWLSVGFVTIALSIGPICKLFPRLPGKQLLFDARRLLGVSAAFFATLHVSIAYFSLFGGVNPFSLPKNYQAAFAIGLVPLLILLAMAFTSFDRAFDRMGIWWFRLHRFIYLAIVMILLHAFLIGVHALQLPVLIILTIGAAILLLAYIKILHATAKPSIWQIGGLISMALFLSAVLSYGFIRRSDNAQTNVATSGKVQTHEAAQ